LPSSLRVLDLSAIQHYRHPLSKLRLPPHLHSLSLPMYSRADLCHELASLLLGLPSSLRHLAYSVIVDAEDEGRRIEDVKEMLRSGSRSTMQRQMQRQMTDWQRRMKRKRGDLASHEDVEECEEERDECMDEFEGEGNEEMSMDVGVDVDVEHADTDVDGDGDGDAASTSACSIRLAKCHDEKYRPIVLDPLFGVKGSDGLSLPLPLSPSTSASIQLHPRLAVLPRSRWR